MFYNFHFITPFFNYMMYMCSDSNLCIFTAHVVVLFFPQHFSLQEGSGSELILLIRLAFSVLNRLLLLRPTEAPPSPVEHCLCAQPSAKYVVMQFTHSS